MPTAGDKAWACKPEMPADCQHLGTFHGVSAGRSLLPIACLGQQEEENSDLTSVSGWAPRVGLTPVKRGMEQVASGLPVCRVMVQGLGGIGALRI